MGPLTSFVKNGEIRPSLSYKIILEQHEQRNKLFKAATRYLFLRIFETKIRELEKR